MNNIQTVSDTLFWAWTHLQYIILPITLFFVQHQRK